MPSGRKPPSAPAGTARMSFSRVHRRHIRFPHAHRRPRPDRVRRRAASDRTDPYTYRSSISLRPQLPPVPECATRCRRTRSRRSGRWAASSRFAGRNDRTQMWLGGCADRSTVSPGRCCIRKRSSTPDSFRDWRMYRHSYPPAGRRRSERRMCSHFCSCRKNCRRS
jgi:hypothetical protein